MLKVEYLDIYAVFQGFLEISNYEKSAVVLIGFVRNFLIHF